jgi:predicted nucleotide-binding protein
MVIQVLFNIAIKTTGSKREVLSELKKLNLAPYSTRKFGGQDTDPKRITCISRFPNIDAATLITLVGSKMNSLSSLIQGIEQVNILHAAQEEEPSDSAQLKTEQSKEVFIIHGRDEINALKLKKILKRKWNLNGIILKFKPGKGGTLIEKFEREARKARYALAILTPDDRIRHLSDGYRQARPNVLFELGWFYGAIGRDNVCILYRRGGKIFSDLQGISYVEFKRDIAEKIDEIGLELNASQLI